MRSDRERLLDALEQIELIQKFSEAVPTSWSSNGEHLLGSSGNRVVLLPLSGDQKSIPVGSPNGNPGQGQFSPDGKFIVFYSDESGRAEIYVQPMPPASGQWKISINGVQQPRWGRDGRQLYFLSPDGKIMAVDVNLKGTFSAGVPRELFQSAVDSRRNTMLYDVNKEGQFLIYRHEIKQEAPITVVLNWWAELEK